ncbi:unnamed protein product [Lota lota]
MPFHFCPQCGTKLQADFRFCPSCGEKLPVSFLFPLRFSSSSSVDIASLCHSFQTREMSRRRCSFTPGCFSGPPRWKKSQRGKSRKARRVSAVKPLEEGAELIDTAGRKWRLGKLLSQTTTDLVYEGEPRRSWGCVCVLRQQPCCCFHSNCFLLESHSGCFRFLVFASDSRESKHILKLGAKDGRIFNEQNFLQRAAKASSMDKWIKSNKVDFLGLPSCVGFGLHSDHYRSGGWRYLFKLFFCFTLQCGGALSLCVCRFLIFPSMGQVLLSVLETTGTLPSERVVLQLACRILDVLTFIHSNEYVHGDISAENIYISTEGPSQVFLAGYSHAFRYRPGGQHVEYREASRTPHEGALEYISVDSHKGAGPCQRSDLQSLGYCMLHWLTGTLPWAALTDPQQIGTEKQRFMEDVPALLSCCFGKNRVSSALQHYLTRVMALGYADAPDYTALHAGLHDALLQLGGALEQPLSF